MRLKRSLVLVVGMVALAGCHPRRLAEAGGIGFAKHPLTVGQRLNCPEQVRNLTRTAQAALLPDLALNFTYGIDAPQFSRTGPNGARNLGYSAQATVDLPLWDWLTTERKVKEARIRASAAKTVVTAAQRRLHADLAEFYSDADIARQQLASLDGSVLSARESLRLTNLRYVDGESTVLDVVDAQNTLISAENAQVDGVVRYRLALAQLGTLTGKL